MQFLPPKSLSVKIYAIVLIFIVLLSGYFAVNNYLFAIRHKQSDSLNRLFSIAVTLASELDGDELEAVLKAYGEQDDIVSTKSIPAYYELHRQLRQAYEANELKSDIYTLSYDSAKAHFEFGITSGTTPYFRHVYESHPEAFLELYTTGGRVPPFEDEFGTWLSALAPIKNSKGEVVSVLAVDRRFSDFEEEANYILLQNLGVALLAIILLSASLYRVLRQVLREEEEAKSLIERGSQMLRAQNKKITDSIQYARRIQQALMRENDLQMKAVGAYFHLYYPRDIVSGDFLWANFDKDRQCLELGNADCTGHGVPGALMSIIGLTGLAQAAEHYGNKGPAEVLRMLDDYIRNLLNQYKGTNGVSYSLQDGMDIGLCSLDYENMKLLFAGAHSHLLLLRKGQSQVDTVKGTRRAIGGVKLDADEKNFDSATFDIQKGDRFFLYTDGYVDQFGGAASGRPEKLKRRRLVELLEQTAGKTLAEQGSVLEDFFNNWKGEEKQLDDVSLIGVEI